MKTFSLTFIFLALATNPYWAMAQAQPPISTLTTNADGQIIGAVNTTDDSLSRQIDSMGTTTQTKALGSTVSTSYDAAGNQITVREDVAVISTSVRDSRNQPVSP